VHIEGSKANGGQFKSKQAIFIRPAGELEPSESGWLVRYLDSGALGVTHHMSVLADLHTRHAMLVKSDNFRLGGRLFGKAKAISDQLRGLFANTARDPEELLPVHDPLTNLPIKLVSARNDDGELVHVREVHAPLLGGLGTVAGAGAAAASVVGDGSAAAPVAGAGAAAAPVVGDGSAAAPVAGGGATAAPVAGGGAAAEATA